MQGRDICLKFCELFEKSLLSRLKLEIKADNVAGMKDTVVALFKMKAGQGCINTYFDNNELLNDQAEW